MRTSARSEVGTRQNRSTAPGSCSLARLRVGSPGDAYERDADRVADGVMRMSRPPAGGPPPELPSPRQARSAQSSAGAPDAAGEGLRRALRSAGSPLDSRARRFMEPRFGHDFGRIRVHTGPEAAAAADSLHASAFSVGSDLVFGHGQFDPVSAPGRRLLAHELTHSLQHDSTRGSAPAVARRKDKAAEKPKPGSGITLRDILPFEAGDRLTLNHLITSAIIETLKLAASVIKALDKETIDEFAALLPELVGRTATLETMSDDHAVIVVDEKAATGEKPAEGAAPKKGDGPDLSGAFTIDMKLAAADSLTVSVYKGKGKGRELLGEKAGIKLSRDGGSVKLATKVEGTSVGVGVEREKGGESLKVALSEPVGVNLLNISRLPKAREGSAEEKTAVAKAADEASEARAFKRFKLRPDVGANLPSAGGAGFLFGAAFQVNFRPIKRASGFFHVPLEAQLLYVPPASVLATLNSGATLSLEQLVPINIHFIAGVGGGTVPDKETGETRKLFGPNLGAGLGFQATETFSLDLRYQQLINLVGDEVDARVLSLGLGKRF